VDNRDDARLLLASRYPLIVAEERDEPRFLGVFREAAGMLGLPVWTWSATHGLVRDGGQAQYDTEDAGKAVAFLTGLTDPGVFLFMDVSSGLSNPLLLRQVKDFAQGARPGQTLVLGDAVIPVPAELEDVAVSWELKPPDAAELEGLVRTAIGQLQERCGAAASTRRRFPRSCRRRPSCSRAGARSSSSLPRAASTRSAAWTT